MSRDAWAVAVTAASMEYVARLDLERLGLHPYLPQYRVPWSPPGALKPLIRARPLFPRYLFIPISEARAREMHFCRGLCGHRYLLASAEGTTWTAPGEVVHEIAVLENEGHFDAVEPSLGEKVRLRTDGPLSALDLLVAHPDAKIVELLSPLFGGSRTIARSADLVRAG